MAAKIGAQTVPIIDRDIFFGDPEISGAQISPDGKYITFVKPFNNVRNIWVKERNQKFDEARPLTNDTKRPVTNYFWSLDSKFVLYVQDQGGNENFRIYAIDPSVKGAAVPTAKDLTPYENVRAIIYSLPKTDPNILFIGLNDRDAKYHDVYKLKIDTGEKTLIRKNDDNIAGWVFDEQANLRLAIRPTADGGSELLKVDGDKLVSIYSVNAEESMAPVNFTPDGGSFYLNTNKGNNVDKAQLELFDLKTNTTKFIEKDPKDEVDLGNVIFSDVKNKLIATVYVADQVRIYFKDADFEKHYKKLLTLVPKGQIGITSQTKDEMTWVINVSRDVDPGSTYIYDVKQGKVELLYKSRPELPTEYLAEVKAIKYKARDGMMIPAYLTIPKNSNGKKLPTVIFPHGGPWARDFWGYNPMSQFLANRGYVVLTPNFRGSTGYGKKFLNAGNKTWGRGAMQHDLTDAVEYLIKEGIADPKRVAIGGGSYGGYATLAGLAFTPNLYAAGFDIVGPSNIITLLNSIPPYWAPLKKIFANRVGDMDNPEERKMLEEQSPLNYAKEIKAPLYVVQGANDPRVKKAEADQIVVALRDLGRQVEYMVAPDEGHGFQGKENRLAMVVAMEKFFGKHLGGKVQEDVKPEILKKLNDITVDIKTVTMPSKAAAESKVELMKSFDGSKIKEATAKWAMTVETRGQKIPMNVQIDVKKTKYDNRDALFVLTSMSGMMTANDTLYVDQKTLLPIARFISQGPVRVTAKFTSNSVEGEMAAGPQKMPINVKFDSPIVTDNSGLSLAIESMPLKEGFITAVNQLDMNSAKVSRQTIKVVGSEKINVPAGEFDTFKVEVVPDEDPSQKSTYWVNKLNSIVTKLIIPLGAQMGGGTITMELTK